MIKSYFADEINELINQSNNENTSINYFVSYLPNLNKTISLDLKTFVRNLSILILEQMKIPRRSDLTYLELKYPSVGSAPDVFDKFFDSSTVYAKLYKNFVGCQVVDISEWVNETQSERFNDLICYFRKNADTSRFIILAQVADVGYAKKLMAIISTAIEILPIYFQNRIDNLVMNQIINEFYHHQVTLSVESKMLIDEWIIQERLNVFLHQPNGVKLFVKAILNSLHTEVKEKNESKQKAIVTLQHLEQFEQNFLSYVNVERNFKRKIGF